LEAFPSSRFFFLPISPCLLLKGGLRVYFPFFSPTLVSRIDVIFSPRWLCKPSFFPSCHLSPPISMFRSLRVTIIDRPAASPLLLPPPLLRSFASQSPPSILFGSLSLLFLPSQMSMTSSVRLVDRGCSHCFSPPFVAHPFSGFFFFHPRLSFLTLSGWTCWTRSFCPNQMPVFFFLPSVAKVFLGSFFHCPPKVIHLYSKICKTSRSLFSKGEFLHVFSIPVLFLRPCCIPPPGPPPNGLFKVLTEVSAGPVLFSP